MYRGTTLLCPACHGGLERAAASLSVHGCRGCGGVWLGPEAAVHLLRHDGGPLASEVVHSAKRIATHAILLPTVPDVAMRQCPSCGLEMSPLPVGAIRVDSCPAHGTWFDRHEVTEVAEALQRATNESRLPALDDLVDWVTRWVNGVTRRT